MAAYDSKKFGALSEAQVHAAYDVVVASIRQLAVAEGGPLTRTRWRFVFRDESHHDAFRVLERHAPAEDDGGAGAFAIDPRRGVLGVTGEAYILLTATGFSSLSSALTTFGLFHAARQRAQLKGVCVPPASIVRAVLAYYVRHAPVSVPDVEVRTERVPAPADDAFWTAYGEALFDATTSANVTLRRAMRVCYADPVVQAVHERMRQDLLADPDASFVVVRETEEDAQQMHAFLKAKGVVNAGILLGGRTSAARHARSVASLGLDGAVLVVPRALEESSDFHLARHVYAALSVPSRERANQITGRVTRITTRFPKTTVTFFVVDDTAPALAHMASLVSARVKADRKLLQRARALYVKQRGPFTPSGDGASDEDDDVLSIPESDEWASDDAQARPRGVK